MIILGIDPGYAIVGAGVVGYTASPKSSANFSPLAFGHPPSRRGAGQRVRHAGFCTR